MKIRGSSAAEHLHCEEEAVVRLQPPGTCPHCGQRVLIRLGAQLSPRQADLFDLIERASSRGGEHVEVLGWAWAGAERSKLRQRYLIKATIYGINERLASTDYRIVGNGRRPVTYRLRRS